ncbi:MAG: sodium-translocating pyrophosphatase [Candidatus Nitrosocaldus sp.]|nr:sodium-translocating pyrophosphatase [Candidatus Nitrosocaldus sp.]MDW8000027.1 sodium-translocating pyrophosphatase [Candidatus Nitrosocaldus sp.]
MSLDSMLSIGASVASLGIAGAMAVWVGRQSAGSKSMMEISSAVRAGASAFLRREFTTIMPIAIGLAIAISFASGVSNGIAFAVGAALSAIAGLIAMKITVKAAVRTAQATTKGLGHTLVTAFRGGATVGLAIPAMALIGVTVLYLIFEEPILIAGVGIGASLIALFIRAGGGIFTKAADLGADLVGKIEAGIPEDDPRNPATIADNVGDNVGDAAGMGSDVYESYIVTLLAAMLLGALVIVDPSAGFDQSSLIVYPIVIGASGLIASMIGALTVTPRRIDDPMKPLNIAFMVSAAIAIALNLVFTQLLMGSSVLAMTLFATSVVGVVLVPIIQRITDYYTNYKYKPVKEIGESTKWGYAANMLAGIISGLRSTMPFMIAIVVTLAISYSITYAVTGDPLMGIYGTAIAAMAMLSLAGIVLSIDAFGPISDNAGGIVEMTGMGDENRKITDQIDAIGNTTKAVTKGFAIASAGLAALAMIQAFQHEAENIFIGKVLDYSLANPNVIIGLLVGGLLPFFISSQLIAGVNRAAMRLVDEVRSQFRSNPGILEGKAKPDYARCIDIATAASIRQLFQPAIITVAAPIVLGVLLGPSAVAGILMGAVVSGIFLAYHMANSGGAWDNAKKYIEIMGRKHTPEHEVAVVGDLIGDPYKDTAGPALNTVIKLLNTVAIVFVPIFVGVVGI